MAAERPEKQTIRGIWVDEVRRIVQAPSPQPVPRYLTLPGALGRDIEALSVGGVIQLTETGALANPERLEIVAVERSPEAVVQLNRRFPGLKILEQPIESLLRSTGPLNWPQGEHRNLFRAEVVNLDLDEPLKAEMDQGQLSFPVLGLIRKLSVLHAVAPPVDWTLCLTLHGEVIWPEECDAPASRLLASNFQLDEDFANDARDVLGGELNDALQEDPPTVKFADLSRADQQRLLMVLVPKRIAFDAHRDGWKVDTTENLRYGGSQQRARMVTWVLRLTWDPRATTEPTTLYREALAAALDRRGHIDASGGLHRG
jgi:hypothetical protein